MAECLADGLSPEVVSFTGFKPRPVPTCACAWCVKAQAFNGPPSLYPACRCDQCSAFKMSDMPEHYLRICPSHGVRYTVDRSEPDECQGCLGFAEEENDAVLSDLSAAY